MSTLVVLGVVVAAVAGVLYLALDQPATTGQVAGRGESGPELPVAAEGGPVVAEPVVAEPVVAELVVAELVVAELVVADPVAADPVVAEVDPAMGVGTPLVDPLLGGAGTPITTRMRSAFALVMLVAFLGAIVALLVAAIVVGAAAVFRSSVA